MVVEHDGIDRRAQAVLGERPNCFKWAWPLPAPVKVVMTMTGGAGLAAELGAASADHLDHVTQDEIAAMSA